MREAGLRLCSMSAAQVSGWIGYSRRQYSSVTVERRVTVHGFSAERKDSCAQLLAHFTQPESFKAYAAGAQARWRATQGRSHCVCSVRISSLSD